MVVHPLLQFANRIGMDVSRHETREALLANCKQFLFAQLQQRQLSARDIALEIQTSLCFTTINGKPALTREGRNTLSQLIEQNLNFYIARIKPLSKGLHFRNIDQHGFFAQRDLNYFIATPSLPIASEQRHRHAKAIYL